MEITLQSIGIDADAFVHPTNSSCTPTGVVGNMLLESQLNMNQEEKQDIKPLKLDLHQAVVDTCVKVRHKKVIHVNVTGGWFSTVKGNLPTAMNNLLDLADQQHFESLVLPDMSCGRGNDEECAAAVIQAIDHWAGLRPSKVKEIKIVVPREKIELYEKHLPRVDYTAGSFFIFFF